MNLEYLYPPTLLQETHQARLDYFKSQIADHPILNDTVNSLDQKANEAIDRRLILLVGGTGVGKTAALKTLLSRRVKKSLSCPEAVPAILVEAEAPDSGPYDFGTLYRDGLVQMKAVLVDRTLPKVERRTRDGLLLTLGLESARKKTDPYALKLRFRSELIGRRCELVGVDEAINVFKTGRASTNRDRMKMLKDQADKLKTLTNKTPAALVLAGAYDFYDLTLCSGQNARRSVIVHMPPYRQTEEGLKGYAKAILGMLRHMPINHSLDAGQLSTELFLQSLGCVGIAKEILMQALSIALTTGVPLSIEHVRLSFYSKSQLQVMQDELDSGVKAIVEVTSLGELATKAMKDADQKQVEPRPKPKMKPGDTLPSHRSEQSKDW